MTLYSKLEKHLPREKEIDKFFGSGDFTEYEKVRREGFNACKAQYDEVLRRVSLSEQEIINIFGDYFCNNQETDIGDEDVQIELSKAIANSPDVIRVEPK